MQPPVLEPPPSNAGVAAFGDFQRLSFGPPTPALALILALTRALERRLTSAVYCAVSDLRCACSLSAHVLLDGGRRLTMNRTVHFGVFALARATIARTPRPAPRTATLNQDA